MHTICCDVYHFISKMVFLRIAETAGLIFYAIEGIPYHMSFYCGVS